MYILRERGSRLRERIATIVRDSFPSADEALLAMDLGRDRVE